MATIQIVDIERQRDEEGEITDYVVEYRIPEYPNTYRTEPIPAEEFDRELVKERITREASALVSTATINVEFPDESGDDTEESDEDTDRRSVLRSAAAGLLVAVIAGGGILAYIADRLGIGAEPSTNELSDTEATFSATQPSTDKEAKATTTQTDGPSASRTGRFSFEGVSPGSGNLPEPWSIVQDPTSSGFNSVEISTKHATHETRTLHMSGNGELDRILVGFIADLSKVQTVRCDVYIERANVSVGEIFFGKWENGESTKTIGFLGQTGGDGQDRFNKTGEFLDLKGDLSTFSGDHELVFNVRGDNEAYFDNLRFLDAEGNLVSPLGQT